MCNKIMRLAGATWIVLVIPYFNVAIAEEPKEKQISTMSLTEQSEIRNRIKSENRILKFYNRNGKIFKEKSLKTDFTTENEIEKRTNNKFIVKKQVTKSAEVSEDGQYVGIRYNIYDVSTLGRDGSEASYFGEGPINSRLELVNAKGDILWSKEFHGFVLDSRSIRIGNNGNITLIMGSDEGRRVLRAYNKAGDNVITLPKKGEKGLVDGDKNTMKMSPNGKYFALKGQIFPDKEIYPIFFDLDKGVYWKAKGIYPIIKGIMDDGIMEGWNTYDLKSSSITISIDLKEKFKDK